MSKATKLVIAGLALFLGSLWGGAVMLHFIETFWLGLAAFVTAALGLVAGALILVVAAHDIDVKWRAQ